MPYSEASFTGRLQRYHILELKIQYCLSLSFQKLGKGLVSF